MSEIRHVAIPLVYRNRIETSNDMEIEYQTAKEKLIESMNEGFKIHATHTMSVLDIGYIVYVLVKEGDKSC